MWTVESRVMHVAELWRYPVKSIAGERLERAEIRRDGVVGDRLVQVYDMRGRVVTARTRPWLLGYRGSSGPTASRASMAGRGRRRRRRP